MFALICLSPFVVALLLALLFDDDTENWDKNYHLKKFENLDKNHHLKK
jgi:hypothetical protein